MLALLVAAVFASGTQFRPEFVVRPCPDVAMEHRARCGFVRVSEDRSRRNGRTIDLNVVIVPATSAKPDLPPLVDIDGGPGRPSTLSAAFYLTDGVAYRARRDIIMVDQRGTGGSNPLTCNNLASPDMALKEIYPAALVVECRQDLEKRADLIRYGTDAASDDLEAVVHALGAQKIDIVAFSYGTTMALRYMAKYPHRVRAAVLGGASPLDAMPPQRHAEAAERALVMLFGQCVADPNCGAAFPSPDSDLDQAVKWLGTTPGMITPAVFMEAIRSLLYLPANARKVPYIVHAAAHGDLAPFLKLAMPGSPSVIADGLYLSITCSESFGLMDYSKALAVSRKTRFGDYRLQRQHAACQNWPAAKVQRGFLSPPKADAAVLFISGAMDPVTPPEWAEHLSSHIARSRHLVIPASGHLFVGLSGVDTCYDPLVVKFLEDADPAAIDAACLATMNPPAFAIAADD
jgi:pimeloyl-ACP methyl ester carboxylesterase